MTLVTQLAWIVSLSSGRGKVLAVTGGKGFNRRRKMLALAQSLGMLGRMEMALEDYLFQEPPLAFSSPGELGSRSKAVTLRELLATRVLIRRESPPVPLFSTPCSAADGDGVFWAKSPSRVGEWKSFSKLFQLFDEKLQNRGLLHHYAVDGKPYVVTCSRSMGEALALYISMHTSPCIGCKPYPFGFPDFFLSIKLPTQASSLICGVFDVPGKWAGYSACELIQELGNPKSGSSLRCSVARLFTYMSMNGHHLGVLSNHNSTWFCARLGDALWISNSVDADEGVLKGYWLCLYYALQLSSRSKAWLREALGLEDKALVKVVWPSGQDQLRELIRDISREIGATWWQQWHQVRFTEAGEIELFECLVRSCHHICKGRCDGRLAVYKFKDFSGCSSFRESLKSFITEVEVYKRLESLQGKVVPKLLAFGFHVGAMFGFLAMDHGGTPVRPLEGLPAWVVQTAESSLEEIHRHGILHGSFKNDDILVDDGNFTVKIVGFSRAWLKNPTSSRSRRDPSFQREVDGLVQRLSVRIKQS